MAWDRKGGSGQIVSRCSDENLRFSFQLTTDAFLQGDFKFEKKTYKSPEVSSRRILLQGRDQTNEDIKSQCLCWVTSRTTVRSKI